MRYYFFQTSQQQRDGEMKPTLRALTGQTFPDGTPVDTDLNVQAPKEAGSYDGGTRLDYPDGTYFCSTHLEKVTTKNGKEYYSVYGQDGKMEDDSFHPVSDDPAFQYVQDSHKSDKMNAAFTLFKSGVDPNTDSDENAGAEETGEKTAAYTPADENGKANPENPNWKERYQGETDDEMTMFGKWMTGLFRSKNVNLPNRIVMSSVQTIFERLCRMGENIDTLASRPRFEAMLAQEKISYADFEMLKGGPHKKYLEYLTAEHDMGKPCTAVERDVKDGDQMNDAITMISDSHNATTGFPSQTLTQQDTDNFRKAFEAGWTLPDLLHPDNLKKCSTVTEYAQKLASGAIELPMKFDANSASYIDVLMAEKKNRKPRDSEGFHVNELTWKILVRNLNRKVNTLLTGPSGCGKTEIIKLLCERTGTAFTQIQMGTITDPTEQLVGKMDIDSLTGGTVFDWAEFAQAIQKPGVVLLDEINRIPRNGENILFSCLDGSRELSAAGAKSSDKRMINVHPDCVFFATANIGDEFTGTKEIDAALMNRFVKVELDYLKPADEEKILMKKELISKEQAGNIAFVAERIRSMARKGDIQTAVSTRNTLECASFVRDGFSVKEAMEISFLPMFDAGTGDGDSSSERAQIKLVISQRFSNTKA